MGVSQGIGLTLLHEALFCMVLTSNSCSLRAASLIHSESSVQEACTDPLTTHI